MPAVRSPLNLAALLLFAAVVWVSCIVAAAPHTFAAGDAILLVAAITTLTCVLTAAAVLFALAAARFLPRLLPAYWTLAFIAAGLFAADAISYTWLTLHLRDSLAMLYWYVKANPIGIASKVTGLAIAAALVVAASIMAALMTRAIARRTPRFEARVSIGRAVGIAAAALVVWVATEAIAVRAFSPAGYDARRFAVWVPAALPAGLGRPAEAALFTIESPRFLQTVPPAESRARVERITPASVTRPLNIFFFVVESLRADTAASAEVMPALAAARARALPFARQVAGGNCTHIAWTSLLHGVNPLYWTVELHQPQRNGSVPLQALKRAGYRVNAFSSYELDYFAAGRALFGSDSQLVDVQEGQRALAASRPDANVADLDAAVFERMMRAASSASTDRNVYFTFLGALHHTYFWPASFTPPFVPFLPDADVVLHGMQPRNAELLRNRYLNAARFTDDLFARFFAFLEEQNLWERSIVVIAGDHGEEFLEEGRLVHSSALNRYQLDVPILIFLPSSLGPPPPAAPLMSQADVFPTIVDAVGLGDELQGIMSGRSLLKEDALPVAISAQCSTHTPDRLLVQTLNAGVLLDIVGPQKRGYAVFGREVRGVGLVDRNYRVTARTPEEAGFSVLEHPELRAALSRFIALPPR